MDLTANEIDEKFFGEREQLLGYSKDNICAILYFYTQNNGELPHFIEFANSDEYDVSPLAQHIIDSKLSKVEAMKYIQSEWDNVDGKWKKFLGEQNCWAFSNSIDAEIAKK